MENISVEDVAETKESLKKVPGLSVPVTEIFNKLRKNVQDEKFKTKKVSTMYINLSQT